MSVWQRVAAKTSQLVRDHQQDEPVVDLRHGEARYYPGRGPIRRRKERPPRSLESLPRRFRLGQRFPPLQRVVHYGPITGQAVEVRLTMRRTMQLHSTGIEHPLRQLDGRLRETDHLMLLTDALGLDRRSLGTSVQQRPRTLPGAKRQWHKEIMSGHRYGFAMNAEYLVLLEYRSPERDSRCRDFGVAYKRIVIAYEVAMDDLQRHPRQHDHRGAW